MVMPRGVTFRAVESSLIEKSDYGFRMRRKPGCVWHESARVGQLFLTIQIGRIRCRSKPHMETPPTW